MNWSLLLVLLFFTSSFGLFHRCPPKESITPCTCQHDRVKNNVIVECVETDDVFLRKTISNFQPFVIDSLNLIKGNFESIIKGTFNKLTVHKLKIEDSKIRVLLFLEGFINLHDSLEELKIENCKVEEWIWSEGRQLIYLKTLSITSTYIADVLTSNMLMFIPKRNLQYLEFVNCGIKKIESNAFTTFNYLKNLNLTGNHFSYVKRDSLPRPAVHLSSYSLSNNPIQQLADDTFLDMPRLEMLYLSNISLERLPLPILYPVWDQLEELYLDGIPLICDCEAAWILSEESPTIFEEPSCHSPLKLKGKKVTSLKREEMCTVK